MKAQTYFANLKRAVTGTTVGSSHAADVYIANTTLPVAFSAITMKEYRFQKNVRYSNSSFRRNGD